MENNSIQNKQNDDGRGNTFFKNGESKKQWNQKKKQFFSNVFHPIMLLIFK
jgi:hypothetical protein